MIAAFDVPLSAVLKIFIALIPALSAISCVLGVLVSIAGMKGFVPGIVFGPMLIGLGVDGFYETGWLNFT